MGKKYLPLFIFDFFLSLLCFIIVFILFTGGVIFSIDEKLIEIQGITNPLTFIYLLVITRYLIDRSAPFLGFFPVGLDDIVRRCHTFCRNIYLKISGLSSSSHFRLVIIIMGISLVIKIFNAYHFYGFFSGDDVEIHEMTFAHLFDWNTKAWNLRSPFFPMVFIYPFQAALQAFGIEDPFCLIFTGRMVVVLFSVFNLYLVYVLATKMFGSQAVGLLSMFFFALSKLHTTMGSSELPRTVASTFILLCFMLLLKKRNRGFFILLAGVYLAMGASIRFGEIVFIVPAVLYLILHKRFKHGIILIVFFLSTFALINSIGDQLYWGHAFFSLKNVIDYTIVQGESTRGIQSLFFYVLAVGLWSNFFSFGLMIYSLCQNLQKLWLWVFAPVFLLSFLPHKEPRYLLPVLPFFCIMVGVAVWSLLGKIFHQEFKLNIQKKIPKTIYILLFIFLGMVIQGHKDIRFSYLVLFFLGLLLLIFLFQRRKSIGKEPTFINKEVSASYIASLLIIIFLGITLFETDGFFFHRSESGVEMARFLYKQPDNLGVAIDDIWRAGGRLYVYRKPSVTNIDQALIKDRNALVSSLRENPVGWIGIRDKFIKQYGYDVLLNDFGYKEVKFSNKIRSETYRLFKREIPEKFIAF